MTDTNTASEMARPPLEAPTTADAFAFPFPPYTVQLAFMQALFRALETGGVGVFESPTGTGKSLSLICGALHWMEANAARDEALEEEDALSRIRATYTDEPDWVLSHQLERWRQEHAVKREARAERQRQLQARRAASVKKRPRREESTLSAEAKKARHEAVVSIGHVATLEENELDDAFLLDDQPIVAEHQTSHGNDAYLTDEVRAMLRQLEADETRATTEAKVDEENKEICGTKIFYCSRTHSQLAQFVHELRKTVYAARVRCVPLGSRQNLCVNDQVRRLGSITRINDRCQELQEAKSRKERCPYYADASDASMTQSVLDIEEVASVGRRRRVCAYYGARNSVKQSEVVTMPYSLLLQKAARTSLGISLKGHIVIVDEAHNLVETMTGMHTVSVTAGQIRSTREQLQAYLQRYKMRLSPDNALHIRELDVVLRALHAFIAKQANSKEQMYTTNKFLHQLRVDDINLLTLVQFLKERRLAHKLHGFAAAAAARAPQVSGSKDPNTMVVSSRSSLYQIEAFLVSLVNEDSDGRVLVKQAITSDKKTANNSAGGRSDVQLTYLLLNPARHFQEVVKEARAVILAGGTMGSIDTLHALMMPFLPRQQLHHFSCGHVIPPSSLLALSVPCSPKGSVPGSESGTVTFDFTHQNRSQPALMDGLGLALVNLCSVIPAGVVCFFPSYAYLHTIYQRWQVKKSPTGKVVRGQEESIVDRLLKRKKIWIEPQQSDQVDAVLSAYSEAIRQKHGALLFCVVGGKMSEGINFSDDLGRGVVMIGLPFPNLASPELQEQLAYMDGIQTRNPDGSISLNARGLQRYEYLCMRAVNQSIGRAIRHQGDYAVVALLDYRYGSERIQRQLPDWMQPSLFKCKQFEEALQKTAYFFKQHREPTA